MPPKQTRLDTLWKWSSAAQQLEDHAKHEEGVPQLPRAPSRCTKNEFLECQFAQEVGKQYVQNGSRDKYGNLRRNVGGRPKLQLEKMSSNRRQPGKRGKIEFSAPEKLQMLEKL